MGVVFLSASVPDPSASHFVAASDAIDVNAAVKAFVYTILGRRHLVWGGHPAITPMVWAIAESLGVDYGRWVTALSVTVLRGPLPGGQCALRERPLR